MNSAITSSLSIIAATSITVVASTLSSANAYTVVTTNNMAGNPASYLVDVGLNSRDDQGRQLNPVQWLVPSGSVSDPKAPSVATPIDLSALLNIKILEFNDKKLSLSLDIKNTTNINNVEYQNQPFTANIVSFGFGVNPNATSVKLTPDSGLETVFDFAEIQKGQQQFPGGFKLIDICIYAANNCSGGDVKKGLQAGESAKLTLDIFGDFYDPTYSESDIRGASVTLSSFPLKFQTSAGSYAPAGVPEPLTIVGSGLALSFGVLFKKETAKRKKLK